MVHCPKSHVAFLGVVPVVVFQLPDPIPTELAPPEFPNFTSETMYA
jgi:hypothetical protein